MTYRSVLTLVSAAAMLAAPSAAFAASGGSTQSQTAASGGNGLGQDTELRCVRLGPDSNINSYYNSARPCFTFDKNPSRWSPADAELCPLSLMNGDGWWKLIEVCPSLFY